VLELRTGCLLAARRSRKPSRGAREP